MISSSSCHLTSLWASDGWGYGGSGRSDRRVFVPCVESSVSEPLENSEGADSGSEDPSHCPTTDEHCSPAENESPADASEKT